MFEFERITLLDYLLTPFVVGLIYFFGKRFRDRYYPFGHPYRRFFLPALTFKMIGAIVICLIYVYYYNGGDTINYFYHARVINSSFDESPVKWFNLLLAIPNHYDPEYFEYTSLMEWYGISGAYTVTQIAAVASLLTLNTFIPAALLFSVLSFTGVWALFRTFAEQFPKLIEPIATATLFIPSVALWGSGIFKDTLCMFSLGWLCNATIQFFVYGNRSFRNITQILIHTLILATIKIYIIICIVPALSGWVLFKNTSRIKNKGLSNLVTVAALFLIIGVLGLLFTQLEDILGRYSLDNIQTTSKVTREWISYSSKKDDGSTYDLGDLDYSIIGVISKVPLAINVTFFRPYLWEAKKLIVFLSAIESFALLLLTIKTLSVIGVKRFLQTVTTNYTVQFTLIFSLIFAFSVGISSFNFGALSRYKIPCIPFFLLTLILVFYAHARPGERLAKSLRL
jgi:hypothetical protein